MEEQRQEGFTITPKEMWKEFSSLRLEVRSFRDDLKDLTRDALELARKAEREAIEARAEAKDAYKHADEAHRRIDSRNDKFFWFFLTQGGAIALLILKSFFGFPK